ncbi:mitochondrial ribosomal protein L31-domain-containing protein [Peziza echinospora]|nr:mitochondrial ribosomal protein L31-domain-containing protein [Peziza echinospora]
MFGLGAFRPSSPLLGGLLWKIPFRLSRHQKYRHRQRLRHVDRVVDTLSASVLRHTGQTVAEVEKWRAEMPREEEMEPRDKYSVFARMERKYRKGIHKVPKWTRVSQRVNPPGY